MPTFVPKSNSNSSQTKEETSSVFNRSSEQKEQKKFIEEDPKWTLDEIILNTSIKDTINDVITFCKNKERLIEEWDLNKFLKGNSSIGINLYGEPGTGKSITAEAIAAALGKKILKVDYSEIQDSKWGATEKNLSRLFQTAEEDGCVIFMDEADGLLSKRSTNDSNANAANEIKSHLLTLVDKSNVIIIYATNLFQNFDRAFFRRILYHIKYPMPQENELIELWKFHLGNDNIPKDNDNFSYAELAKHSDGLLAGGDIKNITLKLCVKLAAGKVTKLSNEIVKEEIEKFKESLADSRGERLVPESEMTEEEKKTLEKEKKD